MRLRSGGIVLGLALAASGFFGVSPLQGADTARVVDAVQKRYESTHSLKARFEQRSYLKIMDQVQEARGEVLIQKPGKMKWTYQAPDPQVLVSNGDTLWLFLPEDNQATKMKIQSVYASNTPALFLAGRGKLTEAFNVGQVIEQESTYEITLFPREAEQNVERLVLVVDKKNYQIVGSSVYDKLGNRTEMRFTDIQVNPPLDAEEFVFHPPSGVEVIDFSATQPGRD